MCLSLFLIMFHALRPEHLLLSFVTFFQSAERGVKLVPRPHFQHDF